MEKILEKWESFPVEKQLPLLSSGGTRNQVNFFPHFKSMSEHLPGGRLCSPHFPFAGISLCMGQYSHDITWAVSLVWNIISFSVLESFLCFNLFLNICYFLRVTLSGSAGKRFFWCFCLFVYFVCLLFFISFE